MLHNEARQERVKPLTMEDLEPESRAEAERYLARNGYIPNSFLTMSRKPEVVRAYVNLRETINRHSTIPAYLRSLMFNLASYTTGCRYCQAHSAGNLAKHHGDDANRAKLDALWEFESSDLFSDAERAALRFAQASATVPNAVTDDHIRELRRHYSDDQIVEMVASLAFGAFMNRLNDTLGTELEETPLELATDLLGSKGWAVGKHGRAGA